ncbi:MAG: sulfurtransferase TusA family protein [Wenzhouxiangellaceae bacterium]|nr:sulfurtransferase TusA family protein [Wenzhouxiangellaceae bacterium]
MNNRVDQTLDARGLLCPEPVFRASRALAMMPPGATLVVLADDPLAELDLRVFCERSGHVLIDAAAEAGISTVRIRRRSG